ncbi:hypothetical protein [Pseudomonas sp. D3-10]|uniref:hypothetical protein n=1 Tax=Pseudomonas sp. D3-10 TaxID=2817392 RepID=UPI003DA8DCE3
MQRVIYFTEAVTPSSAELSQIASLLGGQFEVLVRSGADEDALKFGDNRERADFVSGSVPDIYSDVAVWSGAALPAGSAIVEDADAIPLHDFDGAVMGNATASVVGNAVAKITAPGDVAIIKHLSQMDLVIAASDGKTLSLVPTVSGGDITTVVPQDGGTATIVWDSMVRTVAVTGTYVDKATFTVVDGLITAIALS